MKRYLKSVATFAATLLIFGVVAGMGCAMSNSSVEAACPMGMNGMGPDCPMSHDVSSLDCSRDCCNRKAPQAVFTLPSVKPKAPGVLPAVAFLLDIPVFELTSAHGTSSVRPHENSPPRYKLLRVLRI